MFTLHVINFLMLTHRWKERRIQKLSAGETTRLQWTSQMNFWSSLRPELISGTRWRGVASKRSSSTRRDARPG